MAKKKSNHKRKNKALANRKRRKQQKKTIDGLLDAIAEIEMNKHHRSDKTRHMLDEKMFEEAEETLENDHDDN